jgi:Major capsid protein
MALPHQTPSRYGQINATGDDRALFLKLYAGEVLTEFHQANIFKGLHRTRTIANGKSASFPMVGTASAKYHTPGTQIEGDAIKHGERIVTIDDLLLSSQFIANIDEAMNHYDVRSIYAKEAGSALSDTYDRNVARVIAKASFIDDATKAATEFGVAFDDETYTTNVNIGTAIADTLDGDKIAKAIQDAVVQMTTKNVVRSGAELTCVLPPAQYYALIDVSGSSKLVYLDRDFGGEGSAASGAVPRVAGVTIQMSTSIPQTDESSALVGDPEAITSSRTAAYRADYSKVRGLIFTKDAAATVQLMDLGVESEYQMSRQGTLMVAKYAVGHNILRPACSIALLETGV